MRLKADLKNIRLFSELVAALSPVEKIAHVRFNDSYVCFAVIPASGSRALATLSVDLIFDHYCVESSGPDNAVTLELPLPLLLLGLHSALHARSASLNMVRNDDHAPVLRLSMSTQARPRGTRSGTAAAEGNGVLGLPEEVLMRGYENTITQDIPIQVILTPDPSFTRPRLSLPDVQILLPPLYELKAISDRFTRLCGGLGGRESSVSGLAQAESSSIVLVGREPPARKRLASGTHPRLQLSANMHGSLRIRMVSEEVSLMSEWTGLSHPTLDTSMRGADHPSIRSRKAGPDCWASVLVDGRDWSKVLSVGRLGVKNTVACFSPGHGLMLYAVVSDDDRKFTDDSNVTYYVQSYSE